MGDALTTLYLLVATMGLALCIFIMITSGRGDSVQPYQTFLIPSTIIIGSCIIARAIKRGKD